MYFFHNVSHLDIHLLSLYRVDHASKYYLVMQLLTTPDYVQLYFVVFPIIIVQGHIVVLGG